jgi:glycosyltransferase involved in cell wall biosynthesis
MKVLNILHLPWFAGTEKAYLTYCELLSMLGYEVICLIPKNAQIKKHLSPHYLVIEDDGVLLAKGKLDLISIFKYYRLVKTLKIDIVFAHSAGIVKLFRKVLSWLKTPMIAVNHGFNPRNITKADTVIALNTTSQKEMEDYVREHRFGDTKIYKLPNALKIDTGLYNPKKGPPKVIGVICRLTKDKGIDYFIEALFFLKSHGYHLKAKIAGDGEEKANLIKLVKKRGLEKDIEFLGWVADSNTF